jgi:hypothetical protein
MTRKDFELIAAAVKDARPLSKYRMDDPVAVRLSILNANTALDNVADFLADRLSQTNPRFDRARFLTACGVTQVKRDAADIIVDEVMKRI